MVRGWRDDIVVILHVVIDFEIIRHLHDTQREIMGGLAVPPFGYLNVVVSATCRTLVGLCDEDHITAVLCKKFVCKRKCALMACICILTCM